MNWPSGFHRRLGELLPHCMSERGAVTFRGVYGDFYQYLLDAAHHAESNFLITAFDEFVRPVLAGRGS